MAAVQLKPGREKSLVRRHPWVFSGAVAKVIGNPQIGDTVEVLSASGRFFGQGAYSPHSQIRCRIWSWDENENINEDFFYKRLKHSIQMRHDLVEELTTNAIRLVHAESDGLPGLVVDQYGETCVLQILSAGIEHWKETVFQCLREIIEPAQIFERSDVEVRALEGLAKRKGLVWGKNIGGILNIHENGLKYQVDVAGGHKTGFYIDQRDNRAIVKTLARGREVLDCFCYTGGFSVAALAGGAKSVVGVDTSSDALTIAQSNVELNGLPAKSMETIQGDVFRILRDMRDRAQQFDMVILDPPKFAPTSSQAAKAARGYKDINLLGLKLLRPGGMLVTFSCSGGVGAEFFQKIVAGAALDAGLDVKIIGYLHQGADHPVALNFPEGYYLKGLVLRV